MTDIKLASDPVSESKVIPTAKPEAVFIGEWKCGGVSENKSNTLATLQNLWYEEVTIDQNAFDAMALLEKSHKMTLPTDLKTIASWTDIESKLEETWIHPSKWIFDNGHIVFMKEAAGLCFWSVDMKGAVWVTCGIHTWLTADRLLDFIIACDTDRETDHDLSARGRKD